VDVDLTTPAGGADASSPNTEDPDPTSPHSSERDMTESAVPPANIVSRRGQSALIALAGEVDMQNASDVRDCINSCIADGCVNLTLDMGELVFMDSSGLAVIAATIKELGELEGHLALRDPAGIVKKVLEISRLDGLVEIVDSTDSTSRLTPLPGPAES
jgi:anti-sigma B factor antagonist